MALAEQLVRIVRAKCLLCRKEEFRSGETWVRRNGEVVPMSVFKNLAFPGFRADVPWETEAGRKRKIAKDYYPGRCTGGAGRCAWHTSCASQGHGCQVVTSKCGTRASEASRVMSRQQVSGGKLISCPLPHDGF